MMSDFSHAADANSDTDQQHIKALLLDDDAFDRRRIRRFSEKSGLQLDIREAPTIERMSDMLETETFDLILIDYNLAEGDGLQALEVVQKNSGNKSAATIMVTGQDQTAVAVNAFRNGCHDFLQKSDMSADMFRTAIVGALNQTGFYPQRLNPHPEDMRHLVKAAMNDDSVREIIQTALREELRDSVQSAGLHTVHLQHSDQFLSGFLNEDEFQFKH